MALENVIPLQNPLHVVDIGAAYIAETPPYKILVDKGLARLSAFDGDERHKDKLVEVYGSSFSLYTDIVADGETHTLYLASPESGMSSILKPSEKHLNFFNGFNQFGKIHKEMPVISRRLDDIEQLDAIDFLKMDIQGSELMVLENAKNKLERCVAIQLEVSFAPLYEGQPSFGDIDCWMRANGYLPHRFTDIKRWSIAPTIRDGNFRTPFNQLLEADIVYIRDPLELDHVASECIKKLAYISLYSYGSPDLTVHCLFELERRGDIPQGATKSLLRSNEPK
jgi:FkbM family methyltransferase